MIALLGEHARIYVCLCMYECPLVSHVPHGYLKSPSEVEAAPLPHPVLPRHCALLRAPSLELPKLSLWTPCFFCNKLYQPSLNSVG